MHLRAWHSFTAASAGPWSDHGTPFGIPRGHRPNSRQCCPPHALYVCRSCSCEQVSIPFYPQILIIPMFLDRAGKVNSITAGTQLDFHVGACMLRWLVSPKCHEAHLGNILSQSEPDPKFTTCMTHRLDGDPLQGPRHRYCQHLATCRKYPENWYIVVLWYL